MVKHIKQQPFVRMASMALLGIVVIMGAHSSCWAASGLSDPTQPPAELASGGDAAGQGGGEPVLQSVMLSSSRRVALINGQAVGMGQKFGDATLVKLTDREAVLRNADGTLQSLRMYSAVEKKVITQPQGKSLRQHKTRRPINKPASERP